MAAKMKPSQVWVNWLLAVAAGVLVFGLVLVIAPGFTRQAFSLLIYATPGRIDLFGGEQVQYVSLAHAVIGGVMVGWGAALFAIVRTVFAAGERAGWIAVVLSVAAWFVPDTAYSLASGYWQNAVLNCCFLVMFAVPLWATRDQMR